LWEEDGSPGAGSVDGRLFEGFAQAGSSNYMISENEIC
jgi:hypothetical protein